MRIITSILLAAMVVLTVPVKAQSPDSLEADVKACANRTSSFTRAQCAFIQQTFEAMRKVNDLVASGEYAKLPKASQETMMALVNALIAGLPIMRSK
jgi:hypothetical protein